MVLDIVLAIGLLVAMGGFTVGLFKMYLTHSAQQSIFQHNYKAAIAILKGAPVPGLFAIPGSDPEELLNQALYLDAMDKLEVDNDVEGALTELKQIKSGSRYYSLAQEIIDENIAAPEEPGAAEDSQPNQQAPETQQPAPEATQTQPAPAENSPPAPESQPAPGTTAQ